MGYYTDFDFSQNKQEVIDAINDISGYEDEGAAYYSVKWYDWQDHIKKVSLKFPGYIIILEGEGEEQGDVWKAYAKDGKLAVVHPETHWPDFHEDMLK